MCRHEGRVRTQGEGGRQLAEERTLRRSPPCPHLALGVPPPELRKINSCCLSPLGLRHFVTAALLCPRPSTQEAQGGGKSCPPRVRPLPPNPRSLASRDHRRLRGPRTELETPHAVVPGGAVEEEGRAGTRVSRLPR